jgi:hypothetical protein
LLCVALKVFGGETSGKEPLWRPRRRWENNIQIDIQQVEMEGMGWIDLVQYMNRCRALVSTGMKVLVP